MANVIDVACYALKKLDNSSTMKLQKIVYYSQALHLVRFGTPLFSEDIEAWRNGPVVPALFRRHAHEFVISDGYFGDCVESALSEQEQKTIDCVVDKLRSKTGKELSELTHSEDPWRCARGDIPDNQASSNVISTEAMRIFYGSGSCCNPVFSQ